MAILKDFTNLDFDTIRSNLRTYLEAQDTLQDYNFDGSIASVLLDILAFNTMYNAVYANMTASERFLSTAQLRSSVVGLAKNLSYTPRSVKAAKSSVTLSVTYTSTPKPTSILLPKGSKFTGKNIDGKTLTFFNRDNVYLTNTSGNIFSATFDVYEGKAFTYKEVLQVGQRGVVIPNTGVDTDLITVIVRPAKGSDVSNTFERVKSFTEVTNQTRAYFIEEVDGERHRIYFGDAVIGVSVEANNEVEIQYYKSSGSAGNNINSLTFSDSIQNTQNVTVLVNSVSSGGSDIESIDSIKNNAPLFYQSQNRAVTARDYSTIVKTAFTDIQDISVWGGEDANPPAYGKVFIAAMPKFGSFVSQTRKNEIQELLKDEYSVMTIDAEIVDPDYLYLELENNVEFSSSETSVSANEIKTQVTAKIYEYEETSLRAFNKSFRLSKLSKLVDDINNAIESNTFSIKMSIRPPDLEDVSQTNTLSFGNQISQGSLLSTQFDWNGFSNVFLQDDENGNINLYRVVAGLNTPINDDIGNIRVAGTINYTTGVIVFNTNVFNVLDVKRVYNETLNINALPVLDDIKADKRQVIRLCNDNLKVNVKDLVTGISV